MSISAQKTDLSARGLRPVSELAASRAHGDRLRYMAGCRCSECRAANSRYECERSRARKAGDWNGIASAADARAHLLKLRSAGVGRRAVQAVTDIADTILSDVLSGRKTQIRARTERLILAVTTDMASDRALISAKATWRRINALLDEGYDESTLAQRLGYATPRLQFGRDLITVRNAYEVARLHQRLMS